jgi:hypothetical protein
MNLKDNTSSKINKNESKTPKKQNQNDTDLFEDFESSSESSFMNSGPAQPYYHRDDFDSDSDFSSGEEERFSEDSEENWNFTVTENPAITFAYLSGINTSASEVFACSSPYDFFSLFVNDQIFETISSQTNIFAEQNRLQFNSWRLDQWHETTPNEIRRFFGLIIWMGLVRLPRIEMYWRKAEGYNLSLPRKIMSRNRFELLLRFLHFTDNEKNEKNDRLSKIKIIVDSLNENFQKYYLPDEVVCVDESLVPFRGRIIFRQYLKNKRHRYGIKIFKLCSGPGYTNSFKIYSGKKESENQPGNMSTAIVMSLCQDILDKGHTICTDNWYTSVDLAEKLIEKNTNLIGTLRKNRRGNPIDVISKKLKRGEVIARENKNGITVLKWKDKRDVLMLSTKHSDKMDQVVKKNGVKLKPKMVMDYNSGKSSVDLSDQMISYCSPLRRTIKWYKKLAFELLLNTCVVNSLILYKLIMKKKISISEFRMELALQLMKCEDNDLILVSTSSKPRHELKRKMGQARSVRQFCRKCYEKNSKRYGRTQAKNCTPKVVTYCDDCEESPFLCLECFNKVHRN